MTQNRQQNTPKDALRTIQDYPETSCLSCDRMKRIAKAALPIAVLEGQAMELLKIYVTLSRSENIPGTKAVAQKLLTKIKALKCTPQK